VQACSYPSSVSSGGSIWRSTQEMNQARYATLPPPAHPPDNFAKKVAILLKSLLFNLLKAAPAAPCPTPTATVAASLCACAHK